MQSKRITKTRLVGALRRFGRNRDGATAIEFAMVFTPFLMLIFAITGVSLYYFTETILDQSLAAATRQIRTGQNHTASAGAELKISGLKQAICDRSAGLISCDKLTLIVSNQASWAELTVPSCTDSKGTVVPSNLNDSDDVSSGSGGRERVVAVVACYPWELLTSLPYIGLGNVNGGKAQLIQALVAFKSEPY